MHDAGLAIERSRRLAVGATLALLLLCLGWELLWAPLRPGGSWLALKALPLCLPLAGLLKRRLYTYRWLSLLVWLYVMEGLVRATSEDLPGAALAALEVVLALLVFVATVWHIRLRLGPRRRHGASGPELDLPAPPNGVEP